jgi:dolichol-phosphate mannosyltransferase
MLPAFNEEKSIPLLLPKIEKTLVDMEDDYRIVVVDDGSTDGTLQMLQESQPDFPLAIVEHKLNRGLGETERDGFEFIAERSDDNDLIVRFDCDYTHNPEYIFTLIDKLNEGYDVVNTSRFQPGGGQKGVGGYRSFISYAANIFMKLVFNISGIRDFSCGFRVYRAKVIKDAIEIFGNSFIQLKGLGFTSTLETIVKLKLLGCRFAEVPFILRYDQKVSPSKMVSSVTTLGYLTMAVLYHWPLGGWMSQYKSLARIYRRSPEEAYQKFARHKIQRSMVCQIGG